MDAREIYPSPNQDNAKGKSSAVIAGIKIKQKIKVSNAERIPFILEGVLTFFII